MNINNKFFQRKPLKPCKIGEKWEISRKNHTYKIEKGKGSFLFYGQNLGSRSGLARPVVSGYH